MSYEKSLRAWEYYYLRIVPLLGRVTIVPFVTLIGEPSEFLATVARALGLPRPHWDAAVAAAIDFEIADLNRAREPRQRSMPEPDKDRMKECVQRSARGERSRLRNARCRSLREHILLSAPSVIGVQSLTPRRRDDPER